MLAGPNEVVHPLLDAAGWRIVLATVLGIIGKDLISEATKSAWKDIFEPALKRAPIAAKAAYDTLVDALAIEHKAGFDVSIGFIEPTFDHRLRDERVVLEDLEPSELARNLSFGCASRTKAPGSQSCATQQMGWTKSGFMGSMGAYPGTSGLL